jgi:ABC-type phosphate/phosphonate transport system substrate-binding protein
MQLVSYLTPSFPKSLFEVLAREIGADLHLIDSASGPTPDDDPFAQGRFDLGWMCSTAYMGLVLAGDQPSVELVGAAWVPDDPDAGGRPVYYGDIVARADTELNSLADLEGATVACNDPVSLSGNYSLRFAIEQLGHDPDAFAHMTYTGGHLASLERTLAGEFDAAVVDSVVRINRARNDASVAGMRVVERLGPWPVQPIVARTGLPGDEIERVRRTLIEATDREDIRTELTAAALTRFTEVDTADYEPVRRALTGTT